MKSIRIIILFVIVLLSGTNALAQGVKIYKSDGTTINVPYAALDSIVAVSGMEASAEYVDLGLSVKWAACNLGAERPEQFGDYYAWGEVAPKTSYSRENCLTHNKVLGDVSGMADYDAASAGRGTAIRIPTNMEINELCERCSWRWTTYNGIGGMIVTGPNGSSIFLPAAGFCIGSSFFRDGSNGYYWTSTPFGDDDTEAHYLDFDNKFYYWGNWMRRYIGQTIRPVSDFGRE